MKAWRLPSKESKGLQLVRVSVQIGLVLNVNWRHIAHAIRRTKKQITIMVIEPTEPVQTCQQSGIKKGHGDMGLSSTCHRRCPDLGTQATGCRSPQTKGVQGKERASATAHSSPSKYHAHPSY